MKRLCWDGRWQNRFWAHFMVFWHSKGKTLWKNYLLKGKKTRNTKQNEGWGSCCKMRAGPQMGGKKYGQYCSATQDVLFDKAMMPIDGSFIAPLRKREWEYHREPSNLLSGVWRKSRIWSTQGLTTIPILHSFILWIWNIARLKPMRQGTMLASILYVCNSKDWKLELGMLYLNKGKWCAMFFITILDRFCTRRNWPLKADMVVTFCSIKAGHPIRMFLWHIHHGWISRDSW